MSERFCEAQTQITFHISRSAMKPKYSIALVCVVILVLAFVIAGHLSAVGGAQTGKPDPRLEREALYRFNNIGVAYMEQYKHEEAVKEFKQALARDPNFAIGQINLAIASYFLRDIPAAG